MKRFEAPLDPATIGLDDLKDTRLAKWHGPRRRADSELPIDSVTRQGAQATHEWGSARSAEIPLPDCAQEGAAHVPPITAMRGNGDQSVTTGRAADQRGWQQQPVADATSRPMKRRLAGDAGMAFVLESE